MRVTVNGRMIEVAEQSTPQEVRAALDMPASESLVETSGPQARIVSEEEELTESSKYRSIPSIVQGCFSSRLARSAAMVRWKGGAR